MDRKNIIFIVAFWTLLFTVAAHAQSSTVNRSPQYEHYAQVVSSSTSNAYKGHPETPQTVRLAGHAMNFTANESSEVDIDLTLKGNQYEGSITWDNVTLYGRAIVESDTVTSLLSGVITLELKGTFHCGGVGGWPQNTKSDFSATLHLRPDGFAFGSYLIHGKGRLPMQIGDFNFTTDTF